MFTGIITATQTITAIQKNGSNSIFRIHKPREWNLEIGESISIDGVCSTVIAEDVDTFAVEYMPETLRITTLGDKQAGQFVNTERSMQLGDLVSGYLVSGHVEGQGVIQSIAPDGDSYRIQIAYPATAKQYFIHKGGVTVDGIALTVVEPTDEHFTVAIIPHTWENTTIQYWKVGDAVNLEFDMIAKYVERIIALRD